MKSFSEIGTSNEEIIVSGHRLKVVYTDPYKQQYTLSCVPHCCHTPNGITIIGKEKTIKEILNLK